MLQDVRARVRRGRRALESLRAGERETERACGVQLGGVEKAAADADEFALRQSNHRRRTSAARCLIATGRWTGIARRWQSSHDRGPAREVTTGGTVTREGLNGIGTVDWTLCTSHSHEGGLRATLFQVAAAQQSQVHRLIARQL